MTCFSLVASACMSTTIASQASPSGLAASARAAAERLGFEFPIALDPDWSVLRRYWLEGHQRSATSVSFLLDRRGVIRHVHPGPAFHWEVLEGDARPRRDLIALQQAIERLLEESP